MSSDTDGQDDRMSKWSFDGILCIWEQQAMFRTRGMKRTMVSLLLPSSPLSLLHAHRRYCTNDDGQDIAMARLMWRRSGLHKLIHSSSVQAPQLLNKQHAPSVCLGFPCFEKDRSLSPSNPDITQQSTCHIRAREDKGAQARSNKEPTAHHRFPALFCGTARVSRLEKGKQQKESLQLTSYPVVMELLEVGRCPIRGICCSAISL